MKHVFIPFMERGEPRAFLPFTRLKLLFSLVAVLWAFTTTAQNITTVAGNGIAGYSGDNSVATSAQLYNPAGVAVDAAGNLYIADHENHRIRKVTAGGTITTVAGTGTEGYSGDDGPAINAQLNFPAGVAVDAAGNLYIADAYNHRIRKVSAGGTITTVAGTAARGYSGDDGPATSANLNYPYGVAVDASGNLYIADTGNHLIRKVSAGGTITMVAGNGGWGFDDDGGPATSAYLNYPYSVAVDAAGNLYIADHENHRIRKVSAGGTITTVAGTATQGYSGDDGPATSANLAYPFGVAVDASGNLYIADQVNHRIRKVSADGTITTVAGNGTEGYSGDDGPATSANLAYPFGVAIDAAGKLYIADFVNQRIRKVTFNTAPVATNDDYSVNRGQTLFIAAPGLLSNDTDAEGGQLTATLMSDPSHGTLTLNPDGGFSYTHNGSATSSDSFTYQTSNGAVSSYTATVNIMVIPTTTVASIKVLDSNPTNANSLRYAVTFADPVSGVDITDFSLATTGTAAGTIASVSGSGTTYEVQVNNVSGAGDLRLDFTSMTGVTPNAASGYTSGEKYMVDTIRPTIASASAPDNTIYKIGDVMEITVNFNNAILVNNTNGIPTLTLETGAVDALASYVSGSGSSALRFKYTVQEGNYNMIGLSLNAFALNGGILTDAYGNAADLTVSGVPFTDNVLVDGVRPTLQTVTITSSNNDASKAKVGDVIIFEFKASEQVSLASVSIPGRTAVATNSGDVWMVTFTLTAEDAEGAVSFSINYQDMQGNPGIAVSSTTDGSSVVFDRTAPVVLTKDITVELDATGTTTITAAQINNGSTDNYSIPANGYSLDKSTFTCENVGPNTVTLTVTDATGNSESTTAIVTVKDVTAPLAKARNITIQLDANGTAVVTPAMIDNGSSDICGTITLVLSKTAFDCSNLGANMVTLTATDQAGNVSTATATITIEDKVAPKAIAKNITVTLDATGNATINAADVSNGSSDNCGIETPVLSKTAFDCSNVGENSVTLTVTDKSGNTHEATAIVTIVDETLPVAIAKNITVQLDATGNATITADEIDNGSSDACGIKTMTLSKTSFDCANVGDNTITLTVTDNNGNVATATAIVKVEDKIIPIAKAQNVTIELDANGVATITSAAVDNGSTDACGAVTLDLSKTTFGCANLGANTVTLTVTDGSGNKSTTTATVTVEDKIAPVAKTQNVTVQLDATGKATITEAQVNNSSTDNCGVETLALDITTFDCSDLGANTVTLTVKDKSGNAHSTTATVTVEDNVVPVAKAKDITIQLDATGNATIAAADVDDNSTDNCGIDSRALSQTAFDCSHVGDNTVVLTVTDKSGNTHIATATVTVKDVTAPNAVAQNITVQLDAVGKATIVAADVNSGSSDLCGAVTLSLSQTAFDCSNIGDNTVTLTVTDESGNKSTQTATVTVEDKVAPTVISKNITVQVDAAGKATITYAMIDNGSTDNCSIGSITLDKTEFTCAGTGSNTVTLTVTDVNGNTASATAIVTVEDKIAPVATAQSITVQLDATGNATITPAQVNNGSSDNCGVASVSLDRTAFTCGNVGDNTVTLTVTDNSGNSSAATVTVTVLKAAQTISFAALDDATYGETPVTLSATSTSGEAVAYTVEGPATLAGNVLTITGAGQVRVTATQSGNGCFEAAAEVARAFQVAKKQLIATADKKARVYGEQNPAFTYTLTGFAGTEDGTVLDVLPQATTAATAESNAGEYAITVSGGSDDNYSFAYQAAKLTIQKATATVELTNLEQPEDGQSKQVTVNTSPAGLAVRVTYDGSETPPTARGTYEVVATVEDINYQGTATAMLKVLTPTGMADLTNEPKDILLYPNPTRDGRVFLEVERAKAGSSMLVEIFTASGRQLSSQRVTGPGRHELDLSRYATGLYMVCITDGQAVRTVKVHKL